MLNPDTGEKRENLSKGSEKYIDRLQKMNSAPSRTKLGRSSKLARNAQKVNPKQKISLWGSEKISAGTGEKQKRGSKRNKKPPARVKRGKKHWTTKREKKRTPAHKRDTILGVKQISGPPIEGGTKARGGTKQSTK